MAKKKAKNTESASAEPLSFEQALARLEKTLAQLEDGQLGLDQSLAHYEQGIKYLKLCYRQLEKAQRKIELLAGIDDEGNVRSEPFEESAMTLEQKQASRSRRRSGTRPDQPPPEGTMDEPGTLF